MRKAVFLVVLVALLSITLVVMGQEDTAPSLCTDGTWYCPDPDNPYREAWNWACGSYFGQLEAEMIEDVPLWCKLLAPPPPPPPPAETTPEPTPELDLPT